MEFPNTVISSDDRGKAGTLLMVLIWLFNLSYIADIDVLACLIKIICSIGGQNEHLHVGRLVVNDLSTVIIIR
jgi:hypothetical protein